MANPVVLLHPLGVSGSYWNPVLPFLDGLTVLTPDLPGHGRTPALPLGAGLAETAEAVLDELHRAGIDVFDVVGASLGGLVAQQLAATAPGRVDRLVLVDSVGVYPLPMQQMWRQRSGSVREAGMAGVLEPTLALWFSPEFRSAGGPVVQAAVQALQTADVEGYARACELLAAADTEFLLEQITAPTLVVCGENDGEAFRLAAPKLAQAIAGARLAWLPGQHAGAVEHPAEFAALLTGFFAETALQPDEIFSTGGAS